MKEISKYFIDYQNTEWYKQHQENVKALHERAARVAQEWNDRVDSISDKKLRESAMRRD